MTRSIVISQHAIKRAKRRFNYFKFKLDRDIRRVLHSIVMKGEEYGESAVQGERYYLGSTYTRTPIIVVVRDDRDGADAQIVTTILTAEEAHKAGAWRRRDKEDT